MLLDTHVLLGFFASVRQDIPADLIEGERPASFFVSVASLWEIAIKARQGKLALEVPLSDLEREIGLFGCAVLPVTASHATRDVDPWPPTNDPFDRLLLAVCAAEDLRLVTWDKKLVGHPLAWRPPLG